MGNTAWKQLHKSQGLCVDCSNRSLPMSTRCAEHEHGQRKANKKNWIKDSDKYIKFHRTHKAYCRENGMCPTCSNPLDPDADEGHVICMNCRSISYREGRRCR